MDISHYDSFSKVYDLFSPDWYYHAARAYAIGQLNIKPGNTVLNLPVGTGQNLAYFQDNLNCTGHIIGIDLSAGMLEKAKGKVSDNQWKNVGLYLEGATKINSEWIENNVSPTDGIDAVLCDLGLSGFPDWQKIIDNMLELLKPGGRLVIMDWYVPKPTLRGNFIKWIGKGEVDRPIYQYLETRVSSFKVDTSFNRGGVFVATGTK